MMQNMIKFQQTIPVLRKIKKGSGMRGTIINQSIRERVWNWLRYKSNIRNKNVEKNIINIKKWRLSSLPW
jgi:hypothetical protein